MIMKFVTLIMTILLGLTACQGGGEITPLATDQVAKTGMPVETEGTYPPASGDPRAESGSYPPPTYNPYPGAENQAPGLRTLEPYQFKESDAGFATIHGILFVTDITLVQPDSDDGIFLVPLPDQGVSSIPIFTVGEVPQADVDERTGEFRFTNVEPGNYALVVLLKGGSQMPAYTMEDGKFVIIKVTEEELDKTIDLEYIRIP